MRMNVNDKFSIIFVHKGLQEYFLLALKQARKYNPDARIIVIGDCAEDKYPDFVEFYNIDDLNSPELEEFRKIYVHSSVNIIDYERFCFERWFLILELIKRLNIEAFLHLDSDVFIYCNAKEEFEKYKDYDFTYTELNNNLNSVSPHNTFWNSKYALESFINTILLFYKNTNMYEYLFNKSGLEDDSINISDMILLGLHAKSMSDRCCNTCLHDTKFSWNHNINLLCKFYNAKKLQFKIKNNKLFCQLPNNVIKEFKTLHFQGYAKGLMKYFYNKKSFNIKTEFKQFYLTKSEIKYLFGLIKKEAFGNTRRLTFFGFIKVSYKG